MEIKRGDIWMVDFGPPEDDEDHLQHSIRPVVIVSNNRANEHSMVLHAVPLTSKIKKKRYMVKVRMLLHLNSILWEYCRQQSIRGSVCSRRYTILQCNCKLI